MDKLRERRSDIYALKNGPAGNCSSSEMHSQNVIPWACQTNDSELDEFMARLYKAISFKDGGEPNWEEFQSLASPHVRLTRMTPEGVDYLDAVGFRSMVEELIDMGVYTGFHETETSRSVMIIGRVAHVLSAYETRISPDATDYMARGVNSLQLVREGSDWQLLSLLWDEAALPSHEAF